MSVLTGQISALGPLVQFKAMQSRQRVEALKKAGIPFSSPSVGLGLLDTGASCSALDRGLIAGLGLDFRGITHIHTPSTGPAFQACNQFDACIILGETQPQPLMVTLPVIESDFATQGFHALIGRDVLRHCVFTFEGPNGSFRLEF
jgi:hypothetical protein